MVAMETVTFTVNGVEQTVSAGQYSTVPGTYRQVTCTCVAEDRI